MLDRLVFMLTDVALAAWLCGHHMLPMPRRRGDRQLLALIRRSRR